MKTNFIATLFLIALFNNNLFADSPLTSTGFCVAYKNTEIVQIAAQSEGKLTPVIIEYLIDSKNPIDIKIAAINQLGWNYNGKNNASIFNTYLLEKYNVNDINSQSADILICYAYLKALDNYFNVDQAIIYANNAKAKNKNSYTIAIVCALIEAQKTMEYDWCQVFIITNNVRIDKSLNKDMKKDAIDIIFEYMDYYKSSCN